MPSGKFYLNVLVDREIEPLPETDKVVAIDVGLTHFCTLSTGEKIEKPEKPVKDGGKTQKAPEETVKEGKG